jgi:hypothetical protein
MERKEGPGRPAAPKSQEGTSPKEQGSVQEENAVNAPKVWPWQ